MAVSMILFGINATNARNRSSVGKWLATAARILDPSSNATDGAVALRGVRWGLLVLPAGSVSYIWVLPVGSVAAFPRSH